MYLHHRLILIIFAVGVKINIYFLYVYSIKNNYKADQRKTM